MSTDYDEIFEYEVKKLDSVKQIIRDEIVRLTDDGFQYGNVNFYDENAVSEIEDKTIKHNDAKYYASILQDALSEPYFARLVLRPLTTASNDDIPSYSRKRSLFAPDEDDEFSGKSEIDMYVGRNMLVANGKVIVYSHNSPLGNRVYDRIGETIEYNNYTYKCVMRRKFDIRDGVLIEVFQDFTEGSAPMVYDKFLARMLERKRGEKRLTDIIPTIQSNQNKIIIRPADENVIVQGCAGSGKTMILMQRLEYLKFNRKIDLSEALFVAPSAEFKSHVMPVMSDLHVSAAATVTVGELYRDLCATINKSLAADNEQVLPDSCMNGALVRTIYSDEFKTQLRIAAKRVHRNVAELYKAHRAEMERYEQAISWAKNANMSTTAKKPAPFRYPITVFDAEFDSIRPKGLKRGTRAAYYCTLTLNVLCFGNRAPRRVLFIDEGQDITLNEYKLIKECYREIVFNVFGDMGQRVSATGLNDWESLNAIADFKQYFLNENYRNAYEITEYCNATFEREVVALGLKGGIVALDNKAAAYSLLNAPTDERVAVIYSGSPDKIPHILADAPKYTVEQCKGLEFERVAVVTKDMTVNEKYVAMTRALSELYVIE